jgi:hypothetical protein
VDQISSFVWGKSSVVLVKELLKKHPVSLNLYDRQTEGFKTSKNIRGVDRQQPEDCAAGQECRVSKPLRSIVSPTQRAYHVILPLLPLKLGRR